MSVCFLMGSAFQSVVQEPTALSPESLLQMQFPAHARRTESRL